MIRLLGVGNSLITGLQGAGKSHFVISQIKQILENEPQLKIYLVNVDGVTLQSPNLIIKDSSFSWVNDADNNSVIIYDEAGMIDRFNNSNTRINSSEDVQRLTMARHQGKTIVFVAQDSSIVHPAIRKLLTRHFHFSNPYNDKDKTHCFVFPQVQDRLDGQNKYWQNNAVEEFKHELDPDIFPLYKSVDDGAKHNKTKQTNKKAKRAMTVAIVAAILIIPAMIGGIMLGLSYYNDVWGAKATSDNEKINTPTEQATPADVVETKADDVADTFIDIQNANAIRTYHLYQKRLPEDYQIITTDDNLKPAGAIKIGNDCRVFNSFGDEMNYSQKECNYLLAQTGRIPKSRTSAKFQSVDASQPQPQQEQISVISPDDTQPPIPN